MQTFRKKLHDTSIKLTAQELLHTTFPFTNNNHFALCSWLDGKTKGEGAFRIWGCKPTVEGAEVLAKQAHANGFDYFDFFVLDLENWIQFPPPSACDRLVYAKSGELSDMVQSTIDRSIHQVQKLKRRVNECKDMNPFEKYQDRILKAAEKLLEGKFKDREDIHKDFEEYKKYVTVSLKDDFQKKAKTYAKHLFGLDMSDGQITFDPSKTVDGPPVVKAREIENSSKPIEIKSESLVTKNNDEDSVDGLGMPKLGEA